jgi:cell division protein FtsI (penicillin-binding protein 3)
VRAPSLFAEPRKIIDVDEATELLTAVLPDLDPTEARDRIGSRKGFVWLKREITPKQRQEIHKLGLPGVGLPRGEQARLSQQRRSVPPDRPRQHRQPGHRRHREMAGRHGLQALHLAGLRHRPAAEAGRARRSICACSMRSATS